MGITTKLFIFLNLVVALLMSAAAVTVFGKQTYWVEQTHLSVEEGNRMYVGLKSDNQRLDAELKRVKDEAAQSRANLAQANIEREGLRKENTNLVNNISGLRSEGNNLRDTIKLMNDTIEKKEARNNELQAKLDEEVRKNTASVKEAEWHQSQAIESAAELRESENEMMQLAQGNAELVRRVTLLSTQLERYVQRYGADPTTGTVNPGVAINGRVLQIEPDLDLVILSVGEKDKVAKGMEFVISRGDGYVSKVRVANVYDNMCSARVIDGMTKKGESIKVSDVANTLN